MHIILYISGFAQSILLYVVYRYSKHPSFLSSNTKKMCVEITQPLKTQQIIGIYFVCVFKIETDQGTRTSILSFVQNLQRFVCIHLLTKQNEK